MKNIFKILSIPALFLTQSVQAVDTFVPTENIDSAKPTVLVTKQDLDKSFKNLTNSISPKLGAMLLSAYIFKQSLPFIKISLRIEGIKSIVSMMQGVFLPAAIVGTILFISSGMSIYKKARKYHNLKKLHDEQTALLSAKK